MPHGRDDYIHGTGREEQQRLSRLNQLINASSLSRLRIQPGERVLDVGSGIGQMARAMAAAAGTAGVVVGVERSAAQIVEGRRQAGAAIAGLDIREGDALALPLRDDEWGSFGVAHTRFLLEHVREPDRVVAGMVRALRPGGRIVLEDDDHDVLRLHPAL
ncbi:MAG TPA: methyltransferase domain-containing protein, partial [Candidatus Krumholzibacteria bacterium]|nr:methyltransferase domain-containing protein [Candidatus Krumholzibacteria bacterium]